MVVATDFERVRRRGQVTVFVDRVTQPADAPFDILIKYVGNKRRLCVYASLRRSVLTQKEIFIHIDFAAYCAVM